MLKAFICFRVLWLTVHISAVVIATWLITANYLEILETPTLTTEDQRIHELSLVPFPTVTLCDNNRVSASRLHVLIQKM